MNKHKLKLLARDVWSRLLYHTGLCRLVSRLAPPRLLILAGHCVRDEEVNGDLPEDMKISGERLEEMLRVLGRHGSLVTIGEGFEALRGGGSGLPRCQVALSMDDGYRDNRTVLVPLLERTGGRCTVFLEARPLSERKVSWSHKYFWMIRGGDTEEVARAYMAETEDVDVLEKLRRALEDSRPEELAYQVKRVLKYQAAAAERDRTMNSVFRQRGGDEALLCERIYMDWSDARALQAAGIEVGGHTVSHEVLSTLEPTEVAEEVSRGRECLEQELGAASGQTFAYPFGRRWDFDEAARSAVLESGFRCAVTTHSGCNTRDSEPTTLKRWMIDEETPLHLLVTEATGGFELLRRLGIDLTE